MPIDKNSPTLREYVELHVLSLEDKIDRLEKTMETRFVYLGEALQIAHAQMEARLSSMNEFRDTLRDQASRFVTRDNLESAQKLIESDLRTLRESKAALAGKAEQSTVYGAYLLAAVGVLVSIAGVVLATLK